jgi:hypothetical protein
MNLIERYASDCGVKIDKPYLYERYFPLPFDRYILVHAGGNFESKRYDYFNEVISMLRPILKEQNYELMQIGSSQDSELHSIIDLRDKTDIHQTAYLVKRAALLIGNDSFPIHLADALNTSVVALYGATTPQNHGPHFGQPNNRILIESDRRGQKPSFSAQDPEFKTVNLIKPEEIVKSALKLLKIDKNINRETLYIGEKYNDFVIEVVMDTVVAPETFSEAILGARMDLYFDEKKLEENLNIRPLAITTDRPINLDLLKKYRTQIGNIAYKIKKDYSVDFIKNLMMNGIRYSLFTYIPEDELGLIKLDFFDYGMIETKQNVLKESLENHEKITKKTKYKTMKFLAANDKWYLNEIDWKENKPINNLEDNIGAINLDNPKFFNNVDYLYIFNETV